MPNGWSDVTPHGRPLLLRKGSGRYLAEVTRIGPVVSWSVFGPQYQSALLSGETGSIEKAILSAESALATAIREGG